MAAYVIFLLSKLLLQLKFVIKKETILKIQYYQNLFLIEKNLLKTCFFQALNFSHFQDD